MPPKPRNALAWRGCSDNSAQVVTDASARKTSGCHQNLPSHRRLKCWNAVASRRADEAMIDAAFLVLTAFSNQFQLSQRQQQVVGMLVAGIAPKDMARRLGLSATTIRRHAEETY